MTAYPHTIDDNITLPPAHGEDATSINANIGATLAIENELGIVPSGVYADVRTRLDILEARINNPFAPAPDVSNPFFIGNTGVTIQAGFGDPNITLAIPPTHIGSLFLREDGYNIQGLYAFRPDGYWHQIDTDAWQAGGDLSGTAYSQTVIGIQNRPVSSASPHDGYVLMWIAADGKWEPNSVSGIAVNLHGDVTGTTSTSTVSKIQGVAISGTPSAGYVLEATSSSAASWQAPSGDITLSGDVTGNATSNIVSSITGPTPVSGLITVPVGDGTNDFRFKNRTSLQIIQPSFSLYGCDGFSSPNAPGHTGGTMKLFGGDGGAGQGTNMQGGDGNQVAFKGGSGGLSTGTANNSAGGSISLSAGSAGTGGSGSPGLTGLVYIGDENSNQQLYFGSFGGFSGTSTGNFYVTFGSGVTPTIQQYTSSTASGQTLTIQAQNVTGASHNGGNLVLSGGTSGSATAGIINLQTANTPRLSISPVGVVSITNLGTGVVHADSSGNLTSSTIVNADVDAAAAIVYSKLNLTGSIVNADISSSAAIAVSKLAAGTSAQVLLNNTTPTPTWTTVSGDITISATGVTTVSKINGVTVSGTPSAGQVIEATSSTTASWQSPSSDITLSGDVTGPATSNVVSAISGSSPITITPTTLQWIKTANNPTITQAQATDTTTDGYELDIIAQAAAIGSNHSGGVLYLQSGAGNGSGHDGEIFIQDAAGNQLIRFQERAGNNGNLLFKAGNQGMVFTTNFNYYFYNDNATNNLLAAFVHNVGLSFGDSISPTINQAQSTTGAGNELIIQAQAAQTGSNAAGGEIFLSGGNKDGSGNYGEAWLSDFAANNYFRVQSNSALVLKSTVDVGPAAPSFTINDGSFNTAVKFNNNGLGASNMTIASSVTQFAIQQTATSSASAGALIINAQNATGASNNGGNLILAAGTSGSATPGFVDLRANGVTTASVITDKFVTNKGRRRNITPTTVSYPVVASDDIIAVGTLSAGITVTLPASPTSGDTYDIKDAEGSAATNNITVSGNGHNIDGAANFIINTNYGSITVVYNATTSPNQWNIL